MFVIQELLLQSQVLIAYVVSEYRECGSIWSSLHANPLGVHHMPLLHEVQQVIFYITPLPPLWLKHHLMISRYFKLQLALS